MTTAQTQPLFGATSGLAATPQLATLAVDLGGQASTSTLISTGTELANYAGVTVDRLALGDNWHADPYRPGYSYVGVVRADRGAQIVAEARPHPFTVLVRAADTAAARARLTAALEGQADITVR